MDTEGPIQKALNIFREHGGILRTSRARRLGIHPRTLYAMRDSRLLEQLGRGLYRLSDLPPISDPDLATVALKIPQAITCLVSALAFHGLTTQVPHVIDISLRGGSRRPRLDYPPVRVFWFSGPAWSEGLQTHLIEDVPVRIYGPAKSIADAFKYRRKIGQDVALEALRMYRESNGFDVGRLLHYARLCRVQSVIKPYLEALL